MDKVSKVCPKCGSTYTEECAVSRFDDTEICPTCGAIEGIDIFFKDNNSKIRTLIGVYEIDNSSIYSQIIETIINYHDTYENKIDGLIKAGFNKSCAKYLVDLLTK